VSPPDGHPARDRAEAAALALELSSNLFGRALRLTGGDWSEAEDLNQEAFTAALAAWDTVGGWPRDKQLAWLTRVMMNKKIDAWRSERRGSYPVAEVPDIRTAPSPESVVLNQHALGRCDAVISAISHERRKVAFLRWYCGWTTREIAEWNGIATATLRGHLMRAVRQLNEQVRPEVPLIDDVLDDDEEIPGEQEEA
jgi:RNA polymerase sigma factor (sigma-70 family)